MTLPLDAVLVVDLTQNVAGPFCTQILGDMGADVIKIERPDKGDETRAWAPPYWGEESATFLALNRNKRSVALDIGSEEGLGVLRRLVGRADVLVQSLRAGALAGRGLDFAGAVRLNPRLVYCSVPAFGARGPLRDLPGYDPMMQAYSGLMSVNGHPGQEPARVGTSIVDMGTGMWAVMGILGALRQRDATGRAVEVTTALFDTALMWVSYHAMGYLGSGVVPAPQGSGTAMIAPYQAFPTADGHALIGAPSNPAFERLVQVLGAPELARDPRFADNPSRVRHRPALVEAVSALTRRRTSAELIQALQAGGVPCAPILTVDAAIAQPQTREGGMLVGAPHPRVPGYRSLGLPIEWDAARPPVRRVPPALGEHTDEVLRWLGLGRDEVQGLRARGVIA